MDQAVFRALGDPTRRTILDLLRQRPHTTGELADRFEQSRFGVMKHLAVLEEARLVAVRREGRKRWNHLNAVPLREMYERWLGPYQEFWSTSLLRLRDAVDEHPTPKEIPMSATFHSFEIHQEVILNASRDQVWAALTSEIGKWWAYRVGAEGSSISLDARLGGRFEERWGDGNGVIWGEVVDLRKGERLRLRGNLGMGGAGSNDYVYDLEEKDGKTLVKLAHHAVGYRDPESEQSYTEGWKGLFELLAAWVHDGKTHHEVAPAAERR